MSRKNSGPGRDLEGILLIDKASGWTSHDVAAKARGLTKQRKIGHTGTLDPAATGLLVLCLGSATRLVEYMTAHEKRYSGVIQLGVRTETDDAEGAVVEERAAPELREDDLRELEVRFTGRQMQRPPAYSAISVGGERAYAVARRGGEVELAPREIVVNSLRLSDAGNGRLRAEVECGAGTYIRSLARDIGEALGCGAHLSALRRETVGRFNVGDAITIEELASAAADGLVEGLLAPPDEGVSEQDVAIVSDEQAARLMAGAVVAAEFGRGREAGVARIYSAGGAFIGVGSVDAEASIRARKVLQRR
ncbi:MAG TPA: tRNA pseudouridine(55) synthase TruB [Tepidiformaceae bacterium]|nr:tRNA pseudouridine(55) synthase TruB [Tepidiformaceae bacterium]